MKQLAIFGIGAGLVYWFLKNKQTPAAPTTALTRIAATAQLPADFAPPTPPGPTYADPGPEKTLEVANKEVSNSMSTLIGNGNPLDLFNNVPGNLSL